MLLLCYHQTKPAKKESLQVSWADKHMVAPNLQKHDTGQCKEHWSDVE